MQLIIIYELMLTKPRNKTAYNNGNAQWPAK